MDLFIFIEKGNFMLKGMERYRNREDRDMEENKMEKELLYQKDLRQLIDYRREENGERLWNISHAIIPLSGVDRMNIGYYPEDKIVMDRILRRVGIDPAEIEMIIFSRDEERFQKRCAMYDLYNKKQYDQLEQLIQRYEEETKDMHQIHSQFAKKMRAWMMIQQKKNMNLIIPILKEAIKYTVPDFGKVPLKTISLAPEEMELIILLASCYRRKNELTRAKFLLEEVFYYAKNRRMSYGLRSKYVPFASLELSKVCEAKCQYEDAKYYAWTGIKILYCSGELQYLVELQQQYLNIEKYMTYGKKISSARKKKMEQVREEKAVILALYNESELDPYRLYPIEQYYNCYIFSEILKTHRKLAKMERKQFCADICSLTAFLSIEKGTGPKRTFTKWMQKFGWPESYYITQLHGCTTDHLRTYFRIEYYIRKQQFEKAEKLFNQLEKTFEVKRLKTICPENAQYFERVRVMLQRDIYKKSVAETQQQLKNAFYLTVPKNIDIETYPLLSQEIKILNNIATGYAYNKEYFQSLEMWDKLEKSYSNKWICKNAQYNNYDMVMLNYANVMGTNGQYKKSTKKEYMMIEHLLKEGKIERMVNCCYNIVWNREQELKKQNKDVRKSNLCQEKLRQSEVIARMTNDTFYIKFLKKHRDKLYNNK